MSASSPMQQFRAWSSARRRSCCWAERRNGICRRDVSTERDEPHVRHGCGPARNNLQSDDARLVPHSHSHSRCLESIDTYIHGRGRTPEARCEIELRPHTGRAPERSKEKKRKKKKEKKKKKKKKRRRRRKKERKKETSTSAPLRSRPRLVPARSPVEQPGSSAEGLPAWRRGGSRGSRGSAVLGRRGVQSWRRSRSGPAGGGAECMRADRPRRLRRARECARLVRVRVRCLMLFRMHGSSSSSSSSSSATQARRCCIARQSCMMMAH